MKDGDFLGTATDDQERHRPPADLALQNEGDRNMYPESDAFLNAIIGYGAYIGICLFLRCIAEVFFRRVASKKKRPDVLTFPRLDVQALAATIPPLTFASMRLLSVGSPSALQLGLLTILFLVTPFTIWFVCFLTMRDLVFKPEIYTVPDPLTSNTCHLNPIYDERETRSLSRTSSDDTIGDASLDVRVIENPNRSPSLVQPHEEMTEDNIKKLEQIPTSKMDASPLTWSSGSRYPSAGPIPPLRIAKTRLFITDEQSTLLSSIERHSSASASSVKIEQQRYIFDSEDTSSTEWMRIQKEQHENVFSSETWRLEERHPEKHFIKRFGFVIDDVTSLDPSIARFRMKPRYLVTHGAFFLHKVLAAGIFGCTTRSYKSIAQVSLLTLLQVLIVSHLIIVRPFVHQSIFGIELVVSSLELVILLGASLLLFPFAVRLINSLMLFCLYAALFLLAAFELRHSLVLCPVNKCRKRK